LLLEQPGSWGSDALSQSRLPKRTAAELRKRARAARTRVILIRRGARLSSGRRQAFFLRTEETGLYQARVELDEADDILDVDLSALAEGGVVPGTEEIGDPLFLVCTHGRHDQCCSIRGNLVSRVACAAPGVSAWECSHIGGDRFAANLVCFPHGIYYGRVGPGDVAGLMHDYAAGTIALENYRGRCCYPFPVQAAEYFARRESGTRAVDALSLAGASRTVDGVVASFALADGRVADVDVRVSATDAHHLTCNSEAPAPIPRYELASCSIRAGWPSMSSMVHAPRGQC
jgi:hypothetical protein